MIMMGCTTNTTINSSKKNIDEKLKYKLKFSYVISQSELPFYFFTNIKLKLMQISKLHYI